MNSNYSPTEPEIAAQLGGTLSFDANAPVSLFATTSFLYTAAIMTIVVVAAGRYMLAGVWRIEASERGVRKSNEEIRRVTLGLLGVLSLSVILYTFNKGLLRGDVGLDGLRSAPASRTPVTASVVPTAGGSGAVARACESPQNIITKLTSEDGICGSTACSALTGCAYRQYLPIIQSEASRQGVDKNLVIAIMCTESRGKMDAYNRNPDGTYDCGLMQINQQGSCSSATFDPQTNIAAGITKIKRAMSSANQLYQNIPQVAGIAATYNCCSNGTIPNAASADCTQSAGFPYSIPKWACPINPGTSQYNMCSVKSYACNVYACANELAGGDL